VRKVTEFTPAAKVRFELKLPFGDTYRAFRLPWSGHPAGKPAIAVVGDRVYASWNGNTDVARWDVLAGSDADHLSRIAGRPWSGLETMVQPRRRRPLCRAGARRPGHTRRHLHDHCYKTGYPVRRRRKVIAGTAAGGPSRSPRLDRPVGHRAPRQTPLQAKPSSARRRRRPDAAARAEEADHQDDADERTRAQSS
jgi:hypothetical protein